MDEIVQDMLGSNNPRMKKVARRRLVGKSNGLDKIVVNDRNSFAPSLSDIEYYKF